MTDNVYGVKLAIRHLAGKGHRKIGFVNGYSQAAVSRDRKRGYEEGLLQAGLEVDQTLMHEADFTLLGGADGLQHLLQSRPDAASTVILIPVLVMFYFGQRLFIKGIIVGGVKG